MRKRERVRNDGRLRIVEACAGALLLLAIAFVVHAGGLYGPGASSYGFAASLIAELQYSGTPRYDPNSMIVTRTWDGGGTTNNWTEAANWSGDSVPTSGDPVIFDATSTKDALIDVNVATSNLTIAGGYTGAISMAPGVNASFGQSCSIAGGTFNAGSGTLNLGNNGFGLNLSGGNVNGGSGTINFGSTLTQTGGTFNGGSGNVAGQFNLSGGNFVAPSGTLTIFGEGGNLSPTTFDHNSGTVLFIGGNQNISLSSIIFNNLTLNKNEFGVLNFLDGNRTIRVLGILSLVEGRFSGPSTSPIKAEGPINIAPTFGFPDSSVGGGGTILIKDGSMPREINWPSTASLPHIRLDDINADLAVSGAGTALAGAIHVLNGDFESALTNLEFGYGASTGQGYMQSGGTFHVGEGNLNLVTGAFQLNGGTFTMESGNATFPCFLQFNITGGEFNASSGATTICSGNVNGNYTQSGGIVNAGTGTFAVGYHFTLNGGTFNASSGITRFGFIFDHLSGTFTHGNGAVLFQSTQGVFVNALAAGTAFNNVNVAPNGFNVHFSGTPIINGDLNLINGFANGATLQAKGNVTVHATADGGSAPIQFNGTGPQTFTNNGGPNTTGTWTVNKPVGTTLTAATNMILGTSQALNVTSGTLYLGNGSNLTSGAVTIGSNGKLVNDSATAITLGGTLSNSGVVDLQGDGAVCPGNDLILIRSSVNGTQRAWNGSGRYRLVDVDAKDMGGSGTVKKVYSGTDSGGNDLTTWDFSAGDTCPPELTISPLVADVNTSGGQLFTAGGGLSPYTFSIPVNNSGGSIAAATGQYTAGPSGNVSDTVRVTDAFGSTADATVNVLTVFVVMNTDDSGPGSLRQTITDSNNTPGRQTINFAIPGTAPFTIAPASRLPNITDPVIIDGTTQQGFSGSPIVELRGTGSNTGLTMTGGGSTVRGLSIHGFATGISLHEDGNTIQGNYLGLDPSGQTGLGNGTGLTVASSNNLVGGTTAQSRNVITLNTSIGIRLSKSGLNMSGNVIQGNLIGVMPDGAQVANRTPNGISVRNTAGSIIGGIQPGEGNVISVQNTGIRIPAQSIGDFVETTSITIRGNSIDTIDGLAIDLAYPGRLPNDPGDIDRGANFLQNYPEITSAHSVNGQTTIRGTLDDDDFTSHIDFYSSPSCNGAGTYIGSTTLTGGIVQGFEVTLPFAATIGHFVTATATGDSSRSTSEISTCELISNGRVSISGRLTHNGNPVAYANVRLSGGRSKSVLTNRHGIYTFKDLPNGMGYTITPEKPNHDFTPLNRTYADIQTNQADQDFTATVGRFALSGQTFAAAGGTLIPLSSVKLTLSGTESRVVTNVGPVYVLDNLTPGNYTLTPSKNGYVFSPASVDITITNANQQRTLIGTAASPLEGRIVFQQGNFANSINADGTSFSLLTASDGYPSFSRDGRKLVFIRRSPSSVSNNQYDLYVSNGDGSFPVIDLDIDSQIFDPEFSPDGTKIAYYRDFGGRGGLSVKNVSGTGEFTIPTPGLFLSNRAHVTWISNARVAFSAFDGIETRPDIYAINIDGTGLSQLTNNSVWDSFPSVSPDGTKIAFAQGSANPDLVVMNIDGSQRTPITSIQFSSPFTWSPDGTKIVVVRKLVASSLIEVHNATGIGNPRIIYERVNRVNDDLPITDLSWGPEYEFATPTGTGVSTQAGGVGVTFNGVTTAGTTTFTPISSNSAGTAPNGFVLGGVAYEISTTAAYTSPVEVCFRVQTNYFENAFNALSLMHNEGGVLVDRTTSRTFATRTICGTVTTLSPFVLAEQIDNALPSITGMIEDSNGNPLSDVIVQLTGTETRSTQTDISGIFTFVNLTESGNYNVQPTQVGYVFSEYSEDIIGITGENTLVFAGTAGAFSISGRVMDNNGNGIEGMGVSIDGSVSNVAITDANGNYTFTDLPADGSFAITPIGEGPFDPPSASIDPLIGNATEVDFAKAVIQPVPVTIDGRIVSDDGRGIAKASVHLTDSSGNTRIVLSNSFGYYRFFEVTAGEIYTVSVTHKRYFFGAAQQTLFVGVPVSNLDFIGSRSR